MPRNKAASDGGLFLLCRRAYLFVMALDDELLRIWVRGWTLARRTPPPVRDGGHWRVDVGWPEQKARHVFADAAPDVTRLAAAITEPYVFIKCCVSRDDLAGLLPPGWLLQPPSAIMACDTLEPVPAILPSGYRVECSDGAVPVARILRDDFMVATGQTVRVEGNAIFDSIKVDSAHRRRGLGRALMQALIQAARDSGARHGVLAATQDGAALYHSLGWRVRSAYASACRQHPTGEMGGTDASIGSRL